MTSHTSHQALLHVVGGLLLDETTIVEGKLITGASNPVAWKRFAGGVGANAARAAHSVYQSTVQNKAAGSVTLHTAVGRDHNADSLLATMASLELSVKAYRMDGFSTGRYSAVMDQNGNLLLGLADVQIAEQLSAKAVLEQLTFSTTSNLLIDANLHPECIDEISQVARRGSNFISALAVSPNKAKRLLPVAERINLLFCNRREAMALCEQSNHPLNAVDSTGSLEQLADGLVQLGFSDLIITDAGNTLLSRSEGRNTLIPIPTMTITHNVNGAGDTFAGATLAAMTTGINQTDAIKNIGLALAAEVLTGKRPPLPV